LISGDIRHDFAQVSTDDFQLHRLILSRFRPSILGLPIADSTPVSIDDCSLIPSEYQQLISGDPRHDLARVSTNDFQLHRLILSCFQPSILGSSAADSKPISTDDSQLDSKRVSLADSRFIIG
jgi:hypothetical protein